MFLFESARARARNKPVAKAYDLCRKPMTFRKPMSFSGAASKPMSFSDPKPIS